MLHLGIIFLKLYLCSLSFIHLVEASECDSSNRSCYCGENKKCPDEQSKVFNLCTHESVNDIIASKCVMTGINSLYIMKIKDESNIRNLLSKFSRLTSLKISDSPGLMKIQDKMFSSSSSSLQNISLTGTSIKRIDDTSLNGLQRVTYLNMSNNRIDNLAPQQFKNCPNLQTLDLSGNMITNLDTNVLSGLRNLKILKLNGNPIMNISSGIFDPVRDSLQELSLRHDNGLNYGGFGKFPEHLLRDMRALKVLKVEDMKMKEIRKSDFSYLSSLEILSLKGNRIQRLPEKVFSGNPNLIEVDISENVLECLPSNLGNLFSDSASLQHIDLSYNRLTALSANAFSGFESKLLIDLSANMLQMVNKFAFCSLNNVKVRLGPPPKNSVYLITYGKFYWEARDIFPTGPFEYITNEGSIVGLMTQRRMNKSKECPETVSSSEDKCLTAPVNILSYEQLKSLKAPAQYLNAVGVNDFSSQMKSSVHLWTIVSACLVFLFIAFMMIFFYRSWSKRSNKKMYNSMMMNNGASVLANENADANGKERSHLRDEEAKATVPLSMTIEQRKSMMNDPKVQIFGPPALSRPRSEPDISQEITTMTTLAVV